MNSSQQRDSLASLLSDFKVQTKEELADATALMGAATRTKLILRLCTLAEQDDPLHRGDPRGSMSSSSAASFNVPSPNLEPLRVHGSTVSPSNQLAPLGLERQTSAAPVSPSKGKLASLPGHVPRPPSEGLPSALPLCKSPPNDPLPQTVETKVQPRSVQVADPPANAIVAAKPKGNARPPSAVRASVVRGSMYMAGGMRPGNGKRCVLAHRPSLHFNSVTPDLLERDDSIMSMHRMSTQLVEEVVKGVDDCGFKTINQYTVLEELGRGTSGKVKLAISRTVDENGEDREEYFAIKIINRRKIRTSGDALMREAQVLKKLRHKHIIPLFEVLDDAESNKVYFVMKYLESGPLLEVLNDGTCQKLPDLGLVKQRIKQLAGALHYLHNHDLIHCDIKPDNVLLSSNGEIFVTDFGSARYLNGGGDAGFGTPCFMAPELWTGGAVGPAVDVWAMGIVLYCMLFGTVPFFASNEEELKQQILKQPLTIPDDCPPEWRPLVVGLLEKNPAKRMKLKTFRHHKTLRVLDYDAAEFDAFEFGSSVQEDGS